VANGPTTQEWPTERANPRLDALRSGDTINPRIGLGERVALELLGRRNVTAEEDATILSPIWAAVLFGHPDQD
jgi:hypothetical protein